MATYTLGNSVLVQGQKPVDVKYGPFIGTDSASAISAANTGIDISLRHKGLLVALIINSVTKLYWYKDGITNTDLVEFTTGGTVFNGATGRVLISMGGNDSYGTSNLVYDDLLNQLQLSGDIAVNGGDILSSASTCTIFNTSNDITIQNSVDNNHTLNLSTSAYSAGNKTVNIGTGVNSGTGGTFIWMGEKNSQQVLYGNLIQIGTGYTGGGTYEFANGQTSSSSVKTVGIGLNGDSGSTTRVYVGSPSIDRIIDTRIRGGIVEIGDNYTGGSTYGLGDNQTQSGSTKIIKLGTSGKSGSTTTITLGPSESGANSQAFFYLNNLSIGATNAGGGEYSFANGATTSGTKYVYIGANAIGGTTTITTGTTNAISNSYQYASTYEVSHGTTGNSSYAIGSGPTSSGFTKSIVLGGDGRSGSTTTIALGSVMGSVTELKLFAIPNSSTTTQYLTMDPATSRVYTSTMQDGNLANIGTIYAISTFNYVM